MKDSDYLKSYKIYIGLKQHFNSENDFNYALQDGMTKLSVNSLLKRKDAKFFVTFTQKIHPEQYEYLLSVFLKNKDAWIGEVLESSYTKYHSERMGRMKQLEYVVDSQLDELMMLNSGTLHDLIAHNDNIPHIVKNKFVSLETLAVVNKVINYTDEETMNPLWNKMRHTIDSYSKLLYVKPAIVSKVEVFLQ